MRIKPILKQTADAIRSNSTHRVIHINIRVTGERSSTPINLCHLLFYPYLRSHSPKTTKNATFNTTQIILILADPTTGTSAIGI